MHPPRNCHSPPRRPRIRPALRAVTLAAGFAVVVAAHAALTSQVEGEEGEAGYSAPSRHLLSTAPSPSGAWDPLHNAPGYPGPAGSFGILLWIPLTVWIFLGVAIVADEYFTPALERISAALDLSPDVAGATFLAAASSAPEFFTAFADTFLVNEEGGEGFGIGTIVGSAVFNVLIICAVSCIPASGFARRKCPAGHYLSRDEYLAVYSEVEWDASASTERHGTAALNLDWYPLFRDTIFYVASIAVLIGTVVTDEPEPENRRALDRSGCVMWYEALLYIGVYAAYITTMKYNMVFEEHVRRLKDRVCGTNESGGFPGNTKPMPRPPGRSSFPKLSLGNSAVLIALRAKKKEAKSRNDDAPVLFALQHHPQTPDDVERPNNPLPPPAVQTLMVPPDSDSDSDDEGDASPFWQAVFEIPSSPAGWVFWVASFPFLLAFRLTIPAVTRTNVRQHYVVAFCMCILWIALLSAMMVKTVSWIGAILGIDSVVMGLVVLAAGTSVPDALGSYNEAKRGEANAAVSNAFGSNVFDICVALGVPWFVYTLAYDRCFQVPKNGIMIPTLILLFVLVMFLSILAATGMRLYSTVGYTFLLLYVLFVLWNILNEIVFRVVF